MNYSRRNLDFLLYEVLDVIKLTKHAYHAMHHAETFNMVLDTAEDIAEKYLRPYLKETDEHPPELIQGKVAVHSAIKMYYQAYCESGLLAATFEEKYGGQQLPKSVYAAADFIIGNAHNGFEMFTGLSSGAAKVITTFGSTYLIDRFALKILQGEYTATMCLTEPQAGSSLSEVTTMAIPYLDDTYKIKGQKIFISAGDHNVTETIIHLVLARTPDAPPGTKGLSLFVVPTHRINEEGKPISNDVSSIGLYHKMGQKSTPAMHLEFGAQNDCIAYLIGEKDKGLNYMFQMMNTARLGVGLAGTYIASSAYFHSLQYAKERIQGKRDHANVAIIQHADVRRMLFFQKSFVEGSLGFLFYCYLLLDKEKISDGAERQRHNDLLELLTPVAKSYGAEMGIASVQQGLQVLGGYGYTSDFILEQLSRDIRIMSIYEGTTGIQAQALLGRQIPLNNGRAMNYWYEEVNSDIEKGNKIENIKKYAIQLKEEVTHLNHVLDHLFGILKNISAEIYLSDATLFMEYFGLLNIAWHWLRQGVVAENKMIANTNESDLFFYSSKIQTMKYFYHYELPKIKALSHRLLDEEIVTLWNQPDPLI